VLNIMLVLNLASKLFEAHIHPSGGHGTLSKVLPQFSTIKQPPLLQCSHLTAWQQQQQQYLGVKPRRACWYVVV
jgi:hypothetical protein